MDQKNQNRNDRKKQNRQGVLSLLAWALALTIGFNNAVLAEASMSYLGVGVLPPDASLGRMLSESQTYLAKAPWYALFTGLAIVLMILGPSLLMEGYQHRKRKG